MAAVRPVRHDDAAVVANASEAERPMTTRTSRIDGRRDECWVDVGQDLLGDTAVEPRAARGGLTVATWDEFRCPVGEPTSSGPNNGRPTSCLLDHHLILCFAK